MKKLLSIAATILIAQSAQSAIVVNGTIKNKLSDSVYFQFETNHIIYAPEQVGVLLNADGSFTVQLNIPDDPYTEVQMTHGKQVTEFIVTPKSKLNLSLDGNNFDSSIKYSGAGSEIANFIAKHALAKGPVYMYMAQVRAYLSKPKDEFEAAITKFKQVELDFMNNEQGLPEKFKSFWSNRYVYLNNYLKIMYTSMREQAMKRSAATDVDASQYTFTNYGDNVLNDDMMIVPEYRLFVPNYLSMKYLANLQSTDITIEDDKVFIQTVKNETPKQTGAYGIAKIIYQRSKYYTYAVMSQTCVVYNKTYPNNKYKSSLDEILATKKKFAAGSPAFDFELKTLDDKTVRLSDLKGKVVYMDFWASWCAPCIKEMPYSKKAVEHFSGNDNVVFLYISIDQDADGWKNAIEKHSVTGINTFDGNGWNGIVAEQYNIKSIPAYFLIDADGNFATDSAPRPSETEKLIDMIEQLLKK